MATLTALLTAFIVGCGGGTASQPSGPPLSGNTSVNILTSSTANNQLSQFYLTMDSLTLTSKDGKTVTLWDTSQTPEFIHLNGTTEPFVTVSVPQEIYTSATASIGYSQFTCVTLDPSTGDLFVSMRATSLSSNPISVNVPSPITISGTAMNLSLDLLVSQSASWIHCDSDGIDPFTITPTFNLTQAAISANPTNSSNGKATNLVGIITSIDTGEDGFIVTAADGPILHVAFGSGTEYQGIDGSSQLAAGMPVDMDMAIQKDGSLLATRIAVYDTNTEHLSLASGPLLNTNEAGPALSAFGIEAQGPLLPYGGPYYRYDNTVFQTSGQLSNIQSLPFPASFNVSNMVAGQNVMVTTHARNIDKNLQADTVTLMPQTINGTVRTVSTSGNFTTYTVELAAYDLFPTMAAQNNQISVLTSSDSIVVYVDSNTQLLNTNSITEGSIVRFNGLVFNDNGTLRMDCAQINDGVSMSDMQPLASRL